MNNKERIISHNTRLQNISNELDTLPEYENLDSELDTQELAISDIKEALVGKVEGATATEDTILEGYSAYVGQTLVNGTYLPHGAYVWKKLTAQGGDFVDFVVSDQPTAYPDGGIQDGWWYEKVSDVKYGVFFDSINSDFHPTKVTIKAENIPDYYFYSQQNPTQTMFDYVTDFEIDCDVIGTAVFLNTFWNKPVDTKYKLKCKTIKPSSFCNLGISNSNNEKIWISNKCSSIITNYNANNAPFFGASANSKIYCETNSAPDGWQSYWSRRDSSNSITVMWGVTEEQFDAL